MKYDHQTTVVPAHDCQKSHYQKPTVEQDTKLAEVTGATISTDSIS